MTELNQGDESQTELWDDPSKDFRQRYQFPEQFIWEDSDLARIDFDGYMRVVLDLLPTDKQKILDVGCGPGLGSQFMIEAGHSVEGIDYSERAIQYANILVPDGIFNAVDIRNLVEMEAYHGRFDVATHIEVFEHIPPEYYSKVLEGIHKSLRSDGFLIMSVPSLQLSKNKWHYKHFDRAELSSILKEHGFEPQDIVNQHVIYPFHWQKIWRFIQNSKYDLRFVRKWIRTAFLKRYNTTTNPQHAGRYIVKAKKVE